MSKLTEFSRQFLKSLSKKILEERIMVTVGGTLLFTSILDYLSTNFNISSLDPYKLPISIFIALIISAFLKEIDEKEKK